MTYETVWSFDTARYRVELGIAPEDGDPSDRFDDERDVAFASRGGWCWFQARVRVVFRDENNPKRWSVQRDVVLGEDHLGGCSYHDRADFMRDGYFRDMVRSAVDEARGKLERMRLAVTA